MNLWQSLAGGLNIQLRCADPAYAVSLLENTGIILRNVQFVDELTVCMCVSRFDMKKIREIAEKRGFEIIISGKRGIYWMLPRLWKRPVLWVGLAGYLLLGLYLPTRVLFIQVEGNARIPTQLILETAAQCGIAFGADRSAVRSEKVKNALLEKMPDLQWAGVNTTGCVAVISVRERQIQESTDKDKNVASIVAARDGVITSITATKGNPVVKVGQAVKGGQVLVSGYTDCGLAIQAVRAEGEVYARTERSLEVLSPAICKKRVAQLDTQRKFSLLIGKKRINLYFGSGILDGSCVKIYEESYITLPGGFQLPIALATESWIPWETETAVAAETDLSKAAQDYLRGEMIAGRVLEAREEMDHGDECRILTGRYACLELIGQLREEEIVKPNGTSN